MDFFCVYPGLFLANGYNFLIESKNQNLEDLSVFDKFFVFTVTQ